MWGQTPPPVDYSGTYYIASHGYDFDPGNTNNWYLCPTEGWAFYVSEGTPYCTVQGGDNGQPFLTTYQIKKNNYDVTKAKWTLTKIANSDYYYIQQAGTNKYIVTNGAVSSNPDRARVHLETINNPNDLDEKAQFAIYPYNGHMVIKSNINVTEESVPSGSTHFGTHDDHKWFTVNQGNKPNLDGTSAKTDGPSSFPNTGGIVGIFTEGDTNADFYLEDVITRPKITVNSSNLIEITAALSGTTIRYTTDGSEPTAENGKEYTEPIDPSDGTTIKAVAIVSGKASNVATLQRCLIQNQNNGWNDNTDFHFYMTPGDDGKVNTTSLFRPSMEWYLIDAKNGFNYIVNASNRKYLSYDGSNVSLTDYNSDNDNNYKFGIRESPTAGTFNICPYSKNILNKNKGNADQAVLNTLAYSPDNFNSGNACWKFVPPSTLDKTAPFMVSDNTGVYYYKIASEGVTNHYIVPPTGNNANATTSYSTDPNVVKSGSWYFEVAQVASSSDWCTYYHIRNAETGEYLYFTKNANGNVACLATSNTITEDSENRYMFTWARTATVNAYYIVPKLLKDVSLNQISSLRKQDNNNTGIYSNLTRGAGNYAWTFEAATLFCNNPVFKESGGNIEMSCPTPASEIHYTTDGSIPTAATETVFTNETELPASNQYLIKAIAVLKNDTNVHSDEVVTLLNKPDITLEEGPYPYKGTAWEPGVTEVSISSGTNLITAPTSPATYSVTYSNNMDAGEATVVVNDANADDTWYILNATKAFTISPAEATVKADDKNKVYQETPLPDPELTATITGMVNNESESLITYTISREAGEAAGLYTITPTGDAVQGNYHVTYETGVFQIGQEITPTVSLADWTYGSPNEPSVSGNTGDGAVTYYYKVKDAGDDTYTEEVPRNVGDYTVKAEIARTDEYFPATATNNFKITQASLTVVADNITKDYLDEDPELTYTVTGIQYGEDRNTILACELQRATGEAKGQYEITSKSLTLLSTQNYKTPISFTGATFTITAKALGDLVTLEPAPKISIYAKDNGSDPWTVSVYTGKTPFTAGTDYTSEVTGPDADGNYTVTVTAVDGSNCTGAAKATYSPTTFYGTTEKFIPYISTTSDLTTSSDLVPYIVSQVNSSIGTVSIVPISYIPQDEPVLLLAKSDVTGITTSPKNPATPPISESLINNNKLNIAPDGGVHVELTEAYMFYKGEFVLTTEGTIKAGRYYLYNPRYQASADPGTSTPAPARSLSIVKDEATGIIHLTNDEVKEGFNDVWYSIDGQKYNKKPTRKGIYIQNGKKQILK